MAPFCGPVHPAPGRLSIGPDLALLRPNGRTQQTMTIGKTSLTLTFILAFSGISAGCAPAKAPGSNPEDMTPEGHGAAAQEERQKAAEHEQQKEGVSPSKPMTEETQEAQHGNEAERHKDYAKQHVNAAEAAERQKLPRRTIPVESGA